MILRVKRFLPDFWQFEWQFPHCGPIHPGRSWTRLNRQWKACWKYFISISVIQVNRSKYLHQWNTGNGTTYFLSFDIKEQLPVRLQNVNEVNIEWRLVHMTLTRQNCLVTQGVRFTNIKLGYLWHFSVKKLWYKRKLWLVEFWWVSPLFFYTEWFDLSFSVTIGSTRNRLNG